VEEYTEESQGVPEVQDEAGLQEEVRGMAKEKDYIDEIRKFGIVFIVLGVIFVFLSMFTIEYYSRINGNFNELRAGIELVHEGVAETQRACEACNAMNNTVYVDRVFTKEVVVEGEWQKLLRSFAANHTYDRYNYNCVDYSRDAVFMLREHGYDAYQVMGHCMGENYNDSGQDNHAWVELRLWVEPQDGNIISASECSKNM
jgi:hypothetical protein